MKQIVQSVKNGQTRLAEVPVPALRPDGLLVGSHASLISAGTERMMLKLAKKTLLGKARQRPDLVRKVLAKLHRDGFWATFQSVRLQLDREVPVGYSVAGEVIEVGTGATEFRLGQRVACAGAGYANHAEVNYIPRLLAAAVPDGVTSEAAAYATVGAIALQGVRNAEARVGETVVVLGLGLLGQLAVQILRGAGCPVVGLDVSESRVQLARQHGAELALAPGEEARAQVLAFTRGRGADAVLITAATPSNGPVELAAELARDRARVVMVGVTGMEIPRKPYYEKELTFIVSRSYGPGRYDPQYEEWGHDYPAGHVRWTEQRNLEAFLDLVAAGAVRPEALTTHRFPIDDAEQAFELILASREPHLGVVLTYSHAQKPQPGPLRIALRPAKPKGREQVGVSFIGAGNFARAVLLPALARRRDVRFQGVVSSSGLSARSAGNKFGFGFCASSAQQVLDDPETDAVFIVSRHSQHAAMACQAMAAGKAVFCEKPLAVSLPQVEQVRKTLEQGVPGLMVGFNRRFAPLARELKEHVSGRGPLAVHYRCNAGQLPAGHWLTAAEEGGRIIGEACHFFDFFAFLTDSEPVAVHAESSASGSTTDDAQVTVRYRDGSVCHLLYTTQGPPSFSKERVEVYAGGNVAVLEDFRRLDLETASGHRRRLRPWRADKGHAAELEAFLEAVRSGSEMPIPPDSLLSTALASLAAVESSRERQPVHLCAMGTSTSVSDAAGQESAPH